MKKRPLFRTTDPDRVYVYHGPGDQIARLRAVFDSQRHPTLMGVSGKTDDEWTLTVEGTTEGFRAHCAALARFGENSPVAKTDPAKIEEKP